MAQDARLHLHLAVGRYIRQQLIKDAWGRGFVSIKALTDLPVGSGSRAEARRAAGYLSKYVTKSFEADARGMHRYEVGQGFQPVVRHVEGRSSQAVLSLACDLLGARPVRSWSSAQVEEWKGPPAVWFAWA